MRRALLVLMTAVTTLRGAPALAGPGTGPIEVGTEPIFTYPSALGDVTYTPGRGLALGDTGLTLGGYTNLTLTRNEGHDAKLALADLSFLILWRLTQRLHVFSELEIENVFEVDDDGNVGNPHDRFTVERLYADFTAVDALSFRGGTFLTPVGRWNLLHAAPLVWTTSRPLVTERPFDERGTGAMVYGSFFPEAGLVGYTLYGQFADLPEGNPPFERADYAAGGRLEFAPRSNLSLGASYWAAQKHGEWTQLGGLDGLWQWSWFEVQGEAVVEDGRPGAAQWGFYLQAAVELLPRLYLVERYEFYDGPRGSPANLVASGLLFRLLSNTVVKAEYLAQGSNSPFGDPGFKSSLAILF